VICNTAVASVNIRPQTPAVGLHTSTNMLESVGRPLRPWVKITSTTVNGLRYLLLHSSAIFASVLVQCFVTVS